MAIAVASYSATGVDVSTPLRITAPTGIALGDLLLCYVASLMDNYTGIGAPAGWTRIVGVNPVGSAECHALFYKIATSTEVAASYFDFTFSDTCIGVMLRITGADTTALSNFTTQNSSSSGVFNTADITPAAANSFFGFFCCNFSNGSISGYAMATDNPTWTTVLDNVGPMSDPYNRAGAAYAIRASANASGDFSKNSNNYNAGIFIAIPPVVINAPTVTTQAVSSRATTSGTGNGNITATGGANATRRGFCYMAGSSGDPTVANSTVYDDGDFGTGAYTKGITGLSPGTAYRVRAYAINSAGTSYGSTVAYTTQYLIAMGLGQFTLTGKTVLLHLGKKIIMALGTFTLTGQTILLHLGRRMAVALGQFSLTGYNVLFHIACKIFAVVGEFTLTGQTVIIKSARKMLASLGEFVLTGEDVMFIIGKGMYVSVGEFVLTGQNILFHIAVSIKNEVGEFALTGFDVLFHKGQRMIMLVGEFTITGYSVILRAGKRMIAELGEFTLTGIDVSLHYGRVMVALLGSFILSGQSVALTISRRIVLGLGQFVLTGNDTALKVGRKMTAALGQFTLTGLDILFHVAVSMKMAVGNFILTGFSVIGLLNGVAVWVSKIKHAATATNTAKNLSTWINKLKS